MDERIAFGPNPPKCKTRLAQRLFGIARFWWTDTQIKQLLLRTLRNEASASRITLPRAR